MNGDAVIFDGSQPLSNVPPNSTFELRFSAPVAQNSITSNIQLTLADGTPVDLTFAYINNDQTVTFTPRPALPTGENFRLTVSNSLQSSGGQSLENTGRLLFSTAEPGLSLLDWNLSGQTANNDPYFQNIPLQPTLELQFSTAIDPVELERAVEVRGPDVPDFTLAVEDNARTVQLTFAQPLRSLSRYRIELDDSNYGQNGQRGDALEQVFYTQLTDEPVFPTISDEELLTLVQSQTFRYFWEFGHPVSGLARERNTSGNLVTTGGSGFGLMAMVVAVERGFITADAALDRWTTIVDFLAQADRFHGAFPHWMNGETGRVIPFSERDDGGDLVETAFLVQGLLTVREYLKKNHPDRTELIKNINELWEGVEWTWYTKGGEKQLYWHWSPEREFAINLAIRGHNETQLVYLLAAASPTYPIDRETYENGYARNGNMQNGGNYYGLELPLGPNFGGPLFFAHYSYLGWNPQGLHDQYADYWEQNVRHAQINQRYCADNPKDWIGYSENCWGLTASDSHNGYSAHSPTNDLGVISPTAAVASVPYTPDLSMNAIRHFYYFLGDRLWGEYGFYDAFNPTEQWVASSYLAIDQGPIILMIENHRTGLLWDLFMAAPEVEVGLERLGFRYE